MKSGESDGFVLVATLWVLAGLTLLAGYIALLGEKNTDEVLLSKQYFEDELERKSTEATLLYYLATNADSHRGLIIKSEQQFSDNRGEDPVIAVESGDAELVFDGTVYKGLGETYFSIQDESGLVSVNSPNIPLLKHSLRSLGVSSANSAIFLDRLNDYLDYDSNTRLNGAEKYEYENRGLSEPANSLMVSPYEIESLLGFDGLLSPKQRDALYPLLTMRQAVGYNINVMPVSVLVVLLGKSEMGLQNLLDFRVDNRISTVRQVEALSGVTVNFRDEDILNNPSRYLRVSVWKGGDDQVMQMGIELMPFVLYAPWRIDYRYLSADNVYDVEKAKSVPAPLLQ